MSSKCSATDSGSRCCLPRRHAGHHSFKCNGQNCPGLPYSPRSKAHPPSCTAEAERTASGPHRFAVVIRRLGAGADGAIAQIAATEIGDSRQSFDGCVLLSDALRTGTVDGPTLAGWLNSPDEIRRPIASGNGVHLSSCLVNLSAWLSRPTALARGQELWFRSADDVVSLSRAYVSTGLNMPFRLVEARDLETLRAVKGVRHGIRTDVDEILTPVRECHLIATAVEAWLR